MKTAVAELGDWRWRLTNLYWIVDERGKRMKFSPNDVQLDFLKELHWWNLILKARQHGFTTLVDIMGLDQTFFTPTFAAQIIAHNLPDAEKIFRTKVKYPYDNLPPMVKAMNPLIKQTQSELIFGNDSSIGVGTSGRSATLQFLHISEYGKICRRYPDKAEEIKTGSLPAVHAGGIIVVESTAEGCYDDETEILTDQGWRLFADLKATDKILSMSAETREAYYTSKWDYIAKPWSGDMVRFKTRTLDLLVTPDHNMWAARQKGPMRMQRADSMLSAITDFNFERSFKWTAKGIDTFSLPRYSHIQGAGFRIHDAKSIPIAVWLRFLGYFLTDGHVTWRPGCKQTVLTQTKFIAAFQEAAHDLAQAIGCNVIEKAHKNGKRFVLANAQLTDYLRAYSQPKAIPRTLLMSLSKGQCRELINSIYLGDGCQEHRNRKTELDYGRVFAGVDKTFQDDLQELALKAGYAASAYGPPRNRVATFTESTKATVRYSNPPILVREYSRNVYCVKLKKDHLLMVRRGGIAVWCGNSGGHFYEMVKEAEKRIMHEPHASEFKLHFYPWWKKESYRLNPEGIVISRERSKYFQELEATHSIFLDEEQCAWYEMKARVFGEDMNQEYPSTPDEAFAGAMKEKYFAEQMGVARRQGRVKNIPILTGKPVNLFMDLGRDTTAMWFHQYAALEHRFIDYFQDTGKTLDYYVREIRKRGYIIGTIYLPHDGADKSVVTDVTAEAEMKRLMPGVRVRIVPRVPQLTMGINAARTRIAECYFHETNCADGLACLDNYAKKWSDTLGNWMDEPKHDQYSHGADAFRQFAQGWDVSHEQNDMPQAHIPGYKTYNTGMGVLG